jgi:hypothetical protein
VSTEDQVRDAFRAYDDTVAEPHDALDRVRTRLRQPAKQQSRWAVAVVGATVVLGLVLIAMLVSSGDRSEPRIAAGGITAIDVPEGWHSLPVSRGTVPTERFTIASVADRESLDPIVACLGDPLPSPAAYISVYEYEPGQPLTQVAEGGFFSESSFGSRPAHFEPEVWQGGSCASPGSPVEDRSFRMLPFSDKGRKLLVRVVTTGDPDHALLKAAGPILDTLRLSGGPPDVGTGAPPSSDTLPPVPVPDVRNQPPQTASDILTGSDFQVTSQSEPSDEIEPGRVVRTDPPASTPTARNSTITMFVSAGPESIEVPSVLNQPRDAAIQILQGAGFQVFEATQQVNNPNVDGRVVASNPPATSMARKGSTVTIQVGRFVPQGT